MVGATTRSGLLSSPLRDRFGQHYHLEFYTHIEPGTELYNVQPICSRFASTARGRSNWPRARADRRGCQPACCGAVLRFRQIQLSCRSDPRRGPGARLSCSRSMRLALTRWDRAILAAIIDKFDGGPVESRPLLRRREESDTIGDVYEPTSCRKDHCPNRARRVADAACNIRIWAVPAAARSVGHSAVTRRL